MCAETVFLPKIIWLRMMDWFQIIKMYLPSGRAPSDHIKSIKAKTNIS